MAQPAQLARRPAVQKLVGGSPVQAKLAVGPAGDRFESEANRVADHVVGASSLASTSPPPVISGLSVQRMPAPVAAGPEKPDEELKPPEARAQRAARPKGPEAPPKPDLKIEEEDPKKLAGKVAQTEPVAGGSGPEGGTAPAGVEASIERMRSGPAPGLDSGTRGLMESSMGTDLGGARVHTGGVASHTADALGARAFTVGQDMFFAEGQYNPQSTSGRHLLAHELTHTVQQGGGSAGAKRVQRAKGAAAKSTTSKETPKTLEEIDKLEGEGWSIDMTVREVHVPKLELPKIGKALKGAKGGDAVPASETGFFPEEGQKKFTRPPFAKREERTEQAAYQKWVSYVRNTHSASYRTKLDTKLRGQKGVGTLKDKSQKPYYVLKLGASAGKSELFVVGNLDELSEHDSVVRPMFSERGVSWSFDADHILEDQLGGKDSADNLWLLDRKYNRSIGSQIAHRIDSSITKVLEAAAEKREAQKQEGFKLKGRLPADAQNVRRKWTIVFETVAKGSFGAAPKYFWTRDQIAAGKQLEALKPLTEKELFQQGFAFDPEKEVRPEAINVFPTPDGGRAIRFVVSKSGTELEIPGFFFKGIDITDKKKIPYKAPSAKNLGGVIATLNVRYTKKADPKKRDSELVKAEGPITINHDPRLGFGGYVSRQSIRETFKNAKFGPLSPIAFPDVQISPDGELVANGTIGSSKALLPGLQIPIELRGSDILVSFPIPTESLNFGPVSVSEAAIDVGVGEKGFFMAGSALITVANVGEGLLSARVQDGDAILAGEFNLFLSFLDKTTVKLTYSVATDDLKGEGTLQVKKGSLPGVESGEVTVTASRESFGLVGTLRLGGVLAGSVVTIGYTPETGLLLEGKDLPLPVEKIPGVKEAKATVRAVMNPETGDWLISGGGKAVLAAAGATGMLDVSVDGDAVTIKGRGEVAKGPASGWIEVTATNRATDDEGNTIEGGPVGDLHIWGNGEASIVFGKILKGTAGLEYTPAGSVIISGEIALPPTFELFPKTPLGKPITLLSLHPPDFWIWGVKLGPVGFGIFAFVEADVTFSAFVGPGQLLDTNVSAVMDLDKPEKATVQGHSEFFVPAWAGLTLDLGGGLKAQVAVAYVKGKIGLTGTLGAHAEVRLPVDISWSQDKGIAFGGNLKLSARPKFELGVYASVSAGVDLWVTDIEKTWGPWREKLGEFGPDMELSTEFPLSWSEQTGLNWGTLAPKKPNLDAADLMGDAFSTLV